MTPGQRMSHRCIEATGNGRCGLPEDDDAAAEAAFEQEAEDTRSFEERLQEGFQLIGGMA
jgi:hypothetical protein